VVSSSIARGIFFDKPVALLDKAVASCASMAEEKILTKHPQGKTGRNINREIYDTLKAAILAALGKKELTHNELFEQLNQKLNGKFSGNISWYGETVKLDLEARKIIERTNSKPQRYRVLAAKK
jgi:hypothetical protein